MGAHPEPRAHPIGHRRLREPQPKILQQLRSHGNDVFVVTEVLQTQKEVEVTQTQKQQGSGQFVLPGAMRLQVQGVGRTTDRVGGARGPCCQADPCTSPFPAPEPRAQF